MCIICLGNSIRSRILISTSLRLIKQFSLHILVKFCSIILLLINGLTLYFCSHNSQQFGYKVVGISLLLLAGLKIESLNKLSGL